MSLFPLGDSCIRSLEVIIREIPFREPVEAFGPFAAEPYAMLLDSAARHKLRGRWSYIAVRPYGRVESRDGQTLVDGRQVAGDPFSVLAGALAGKGGQGLAGGPPFQGGAVGFFGYELGRYLEKKAPALHRVPQGQPDMAFGLYDSIIAFDRIEGRGFVVAPDESNAESLARLITEAPPLSDPKEKPNLNWQPEISRTDYLAKVQRVIDYIFAGDIFQANMTMRFLAERPANFDPFAAYRLLRAVNPAPFAAFLNIATDYQVISASPERFLSMTAAGQIETRPIKGTRPRGATPDEDAAIAATLKASVKDNAENLMIVDVLRNDIGRVAEVGSVKVPMLAGLESYASVHHLVSVILGQLKKSLGPIDLIRASFPGGSITGAPKVRAMEIIDELEPAARGPYCGSVAWIGFDGAMDSSIIIRTVVATKDQIITQAGGGIVADSEPEAEYREMLTKARLQLTALSQQEETCWSG